MQAQSQWSNVACATPVPAESCDEQAPLKREDSGVTTASTTTTSSSTALFEEVCSSVEGGAETDDNDDVETEEDKGVDVEQLSKSLDSRLEQIGTAEIIGTWSKVYEFMTSGSSITTVNPFMSRRAPPISVQQYFERISVHFQCSKACLVLGPIYIDRFHKMHPEFEINKLSIHRLLATSIIVAAKFHDDIFYSNSHYAKVTGLPVKELNFLEACFVKLLRWQLQVSPEEFEQYIAAVHGSSSSGAVDS